MESQGPKAFLQARRVFRSFETSEGTLEVLKGVDLTLAKGEMVAVVGESGVGKSTLLHILGGLDNPTSGEIELAGESMNNLNESSRASFRNRHVGFIFQHHYLLEDFSALENVMMPALIAGQSVSRAAAKAEQLLENVGLKGRVKHRPRQLSGGEQQRVAVARALANDPSVVLADEPSGNLDVATGEKLHQILSSLNETEGITFLIATHNHDLARRCRRVVEIKDGRLWDSAESRV